MTITKIDIEGFETGGEEGATLNNGCVVQEGGIDGSGPEPWN